MHSRKTTLIAGALLALAALPACADDSTGFYTGLGFGRVSADESNGKCVSTAQANGLAAASCSVNKTDTTFKLMAGFTFNRYLGLEAAYADLGQVKAKITGTSGSTTQLSQTATAYYADVVGTLPIAQDFGLDAKAGLYSASTQGSDTAGDTSTTHNNSGLTYGLGASYRLTESLVTRLEYERFNNIGRDDNGSCYTCAATTKYTISTMTADLLYSW